MYMRWTTPSLWKAPKTITDLFPCFGTNITPAITCKQIAFEIIALKDLLAIFSSLCLVLLSEFQLDFPILLLE